MENIMTQGVWTLYDALLILTFLKMLINGEQQLLRDWIVEKTAEINQPVYLRDVMASEWKFRMKNMLC